MTAVMFALPPEALQPIVPSRPNLLFRWTDWRGKPWEFGEQKSGIYLAPDGIRGMGMPPIIRYTRTSPALHGSRYRGMTVGEREAFWPLSTSHPAGGQPWVDRDADFWAGLHPEHTGRWDVIQPDGRYLSLDLRLSDDGGWAPGFQPTIVGKAKYGVTLVAERPFWYGQPITQGWKARDRRLFFGGDLVGDPGAVESWPPLWINESGDYSEAEIDNPGDVEAWTVWKIFGPCDGAHVGVGGQILDVPIELDAGQSVTIDTDPEEQVAIRENGLDVTPLLGDPNFAPVPPGEQVQLSIETLGGGAITATIVPRYFRALRPTPVEEAA